MAGILLNDAYSLWKLCYSKSWMCMEKQLSDPKKRDNLKVEEEQLDTFTDIAQRMRRENEPFPETYYDLRILLSRRLND